MGGLGDMGDKLERGSDAAIEKGGDLADDRTGGQHADKVDKGQDLLDDKIGDKDQR